MVLEHIDQGHIQAFRKKLNELISLIFRLWVCHWQCDLEKVAFTFLNLDIFICKTGGRVL